MLKVKAEVQVVVFLMAAVASGARTAWSKAIDSSTTSNKNVAEHKPALYPLVEPHCTKQNRDEAERLFQKGMKANKERHYNLAIDLFTTSIKLCPIPEHLVFRSLTYAALGNNVAAVADCEQAIKINPKLPAAHYYRGKYYKFYGRYAEARAEMALSLKLGMPDRSLVVADIKSIDEAVARRELDLSKGPAHMQAQQLVARARRNAKSENNEAALRDLLRAVKMDPADADAHYALGQLYAGLEKKEDAEKQYSEAIKLDPRSPAYYSRGTLYFSSGKNELALADFKKCIELDREVPSSLRLQAECCSRLKRYDEAVRICGLLIAREPNDGTHYLLRADILRRMKQYKLAIADYNRALEMNKNIPGLSGVYLERGKTYELRGDPASAKRDFELARKSADDVELDLFPGRKKN